MLFCKTLLLLFWLLSPSEGNIECDAVGTVFSVKHTTTWDCCNTSSPGLGMGCDGDGHITWLSYNAHEQSEGQADGCDAAGQRELALTELPALTSLALDYYVDSSRCPRLWHTLGNLTRLQRLSLKGANVSEAAVPGETASPLKVLDLSDTSLTQVPHWLRRQFIHLSDLILTSSHALAVDPSTTLCSPYLTHLTLSPVVTPNLMWLQNCTQLTRLNLSLQPMSNVDELLEPLGRLEQLELISIKVRLDPSNTTAFPAWLANLTRLQTLEYHANVRDTLPENLLSSLPLTQLDLSHNQLHGNLPIALSRRQLVSLNLTNNDFSGRLPPSLINTTSCSIGGNSPQLCALDQTNLALDNDLSYDFYWTLCEHCGIRYGFVDLMMRYKIQLLVILACLILLLIGWIWVSVRNHQRASFWTLVGLLYSLIALINLITSIVHLGLQGYRVTLCLMTITTGLYLSVNAYLYRYCCRRFNILVIRRTWPVLVLCTLDLCNFQLYEIPKLNLSAYRKPIDYSVVTVLSFAKVMLGDIPHTAVTIFLLVKHSPVVAILLTCVTSSIAILRAVIQFGQLWYRARHAYHPMVSNVVSSVSTSTMAETQPMP